MTCLTQWNQHMNIFVLDQDPYKAAEYHCDQHVVKMTLESAQMLCTARRHLGLAAPYRATHPKHPCTLWLLESRANWRWLIQLADGLNQQYQSRYGHTHPHKSWLVITSLEEPEELPDID